ncbi:hypothetical protein OEZ86_009215 [Tetradesmus obliquus]|nr:hypothetical protein OEZ86_009215 [Tetradesmus obliquus]
MRSGLLLTFVCALVAFSGCIHAVQYNCQMGCPLTGPSVCGQDGITYQHECLAVCQKVKVAGRGPCGLQAQLLSRDVAFAPTSNWDASPLVLPAAINRYSSEGFRLAGRALSGSFQPQASYVKGWRAAAAAAAAAAAGTAAVSANTLMSMQ